MGLFKENINLKSQYSFLIQLGFRYGMNSGARGEAGYTKVMNHSGNERLWITVNPIEKKLYLYNEWECGGMLWDRTIDIPSEDLSDKDDLIDWIDKQI